MGFLNSLAKFFIGAPAANRGNFLPIAVRCNRCGEILRANINLSNDLSVEFNEKGEIKEYRCRKVLQGTGNGEKVCFQTVEAELIFKPDRSLSEKNITGGKFVDEE